LIVASVAPASSRFAAVALQVQLNHRVDPLLLEVRLKMQVQVHLLGSEVLAVRLFQRAEIIVRGFAEVAICLPTGGEVQPPFPRPRPQRLNRRFRWARVTPSLSRPMTR
jgi:hypothetical protein